MGTAKRSPRSGGTRIGRGSSPAITASSRAQSSTVQAIGPAESKEVDSGSTPSSGMRRCVGLKPTSPLSAEGMRSEPPVSVPMAPAAMPSATEIAPPEVEPPGMRPVARSKTFFGVP